MMRLREDFGVESVTDLAAEVVRLGEELASETARAEKLERRWCKRWDKKLAGKS